MTVTVNTGTVQRENPSPDEAAWTIDELARLTAVPTRTIREYRTLGLLPAPTKRGRVAIYDDQHLRRLRAIGRLQVRGYSLAGMRDLFAAWEAGQGLGSILDLDERGTEMLDEAPAELTREQLAASVPGITAAGAFRAARDAGLVHRDRSGRLIVRSLALLTLVGDAVRVGVPILDAIAFAASAREATATIADAAADMFITHIWDERDADAPRAEVVAFAQRARLLLAQAAASLLAAEIGRSISNVASSDHHHALNLLLDQLRVGVIVPASDEPPGQSVNSAKGPRE